MRHPDNSQRLAEPRHWTQGVMRADDGVSWQVWAPHCDCLELLVWLDGACHVLEMTPRGNGYFVQQTGHVPTGTRYAYRLAAGEFPDPASRWQPSGVHAPSAVFWPEEYAWTTGHWCGVPLDDLVLYELHVGTFTAAGTFDAMVPRLESLRELGVTAIELMPVAAFPGTRNWGYDGVYPRAVQESYGGPRGLQRLIDAAHRCGLAVVLDVVFNHLGPEGNYLSRFGPYFTDRYRTPWGPALNFDGADSDAVRQYVIDTACAWVRDYRLDGLRLDAVHAVYDCGAIHILTELQSAVQQVAQEQRRIVHVMAESNLNDVRLLRPSSVGGMGLDAVWNDDFHHAVHALLTGERDGYYRAYGQPEQLTKALNEVYVYTGRYNPYRRRCHGASAEKIDRRRFVVALQTHDQVGNRARGERLSQLVSSAQLRLACGLLMVSPFTPILFMGEEYGETRPFPYFCSFEDAALSEGVRQGRQRDAVERGFSTTTDAFDSTDERPFAAPHWEWESSVRAGCARLYGV